VTALVFTALAVLLVAGPLYVALTHHRQENPMPDLPPPPNDVPVALTTDVVDQLLSQVVRDRAVGYWQADEHRGTLAGAETWLSSLRDWLAAGGQTGTVPEGPAWEPIEKPRGAWVVYYPDRSAVWVYVDELAAMRKGVEASAQVRWLAEGESL